MFHVPDSSTPPSTPGSQRYGANNPSTTPAGPPPTSFTSNSFTPAGPPPSSVFGSSNLHTGKLAFQQSGHVNSPSLRGQLHSNPFASQSRTRNGTPAAPFSNRGGFQVPDSSPPQAGEEDEEGSEDGDGEHDEYEDDADAMEEDEDDYTEDDRSAYALSRKQPFNTSIFSHLDSPRGVKRSRQGETMEQSVLSRKSEMELEKFDTNSIAKGLAATMPPAALQEPDDLILQTEKCVRKLSDSDVPDTALPPTDMLTSVARELKALWARHARKTRDKRPKSYQGIGPSDEESAVAKANFVCSLLLQLHHPSRNDPEKDVSASQYGRLSNFKNSSRRSQELPAMPKLLLDWLNTYHDPIGIGDYERIVRSGQGFSAHESFWDVMFSCIFRGRFNEAIRLLEGADFSVANSAVVDGYDEPGYRGKQLDSVERVMDRAIQLLRNCPAVRDDDWDMKGNDWRLFRHRVAQAIQDLRDFAEGESQDRDDFTESFQAENFGISMQSGFGLSTASRKAESKVPWAVYESLLDLYNHLLCEPEEIVKSAADWIEAVIGLAVWWPGDDEEIPQGSLSMSMSRRSFTKSTRTRPADVTPVLAYRKRLGMCLARVHNEDDEQLEINTTNPVEIALACVFNDDIDGLINILRGWSMCMTSAIVELASAGGWLGESPSRSKDIMKGFDQSDLMVLSYGQEDDGRLKKDDILVRYAGLVSRRDVLRMDDGSFALEGWEVTIQILSRLDNPETAVAKIDELLGRLPLDSQSRVDKVLALCSSLDLVTQAKTVSERYANSLVENSYNYGDALLYYARAHNPKKIKEVLDLLTSLCLVQSMAYPPTSELDERLHSFISAPKRTLTELSRTDYEAAQQLSTYLSGYATLRKFYDLRDEEANLKPGQKPTLRPLARKREAAAALIAVIDSAGDSIRGGLYNPDVDVVVQVDGLLTLLAEALPFVNQPKPLLTLPQAFTLLRAIEDLQTVSPRIYAQCEDCLQSALANARGEEAPSPMALLKKSVSGMSGSSQFELVGSSMLNSREKERGNGSVESSAVLVKGEVRRGWDWRKGFKKEVSGEDVLRVLRLGLAGEVAREWAEGWE